MPQAAASPKAAEAPERTLTDELLDRIGSIPEDERDIPEAQFMRAIHLERERARILKQVAANRSFLRTMDESEALDDDLSDWLAVFYPVKEREASRSKDEVLLTRKNHDSATRARKG